jgi:hypothetical protein
MAKLKDILESDEVGAVRAIGGFAACVGGLIVLCYIFFSALPHFMCRNNIINKSFSPDGKLKALAYRRDAGATTGFSICVSILKSNETLYNDQRGNVFGQPGYWAEAKWLDNKTLMISHHQAPFTPLKKSQFTAFDREIKVKYQIVPDASKQEEY